MAYSHYIRHHSPAPSSLDKAAVLSRVVVDLLNYDGVMARDSDAMTRGLHVMFCRDRGASEVLSRVLWSLSGQTIFLAWV